MGTYKGKINYSYNIKKLNIVVKYVKENGSNKQKIYKYKECKSLLNYVKKEGNVFKSDKKINEKTGVKHLIISPINPSLYNNLTEKQKEKVKEISKDVLFNTFFKYGFIGGIEEKNRTIDNEELDHFHIHISVNSRYDIGLKQMNYIKRQLDKGFTNDPELKEVLGLKTTKELKSESMKKTYFNKYFKKNGITVRNNFEEIIQINNDISEITNRKDYLIDLKEKFNDDNFILYSKMYIHKDNIKYDINNVKNCIQYKKDLIEMYDKDISNYIEKKELEKDILYNRMNYSMGIIKETIKNDIQGYYSFLNYTNNLQILYYKQLLKNKTINRETFLSYVINNKYYIKQQIKYYREEKHIEIKKKQEELQKSIKWTLNQYDSYIKNKRELKKQSIKDIKISQKELEKLINNNKELTKNINNKIEYNKIILDLISKYLKKQNEEMYKKIIEKQKIQHNYKI